MSIPNRFAGLALVLLLTAPAVIPAQTQTASALPNYVNLIDQTEKWFTSDFPGKSVDLRMHTRVNGTFNGAVIEEREILLGRDVIERHRLLYERDGSGDVYYYGDLDGRVLDEPMLWVDAPLAPGKTWTASIPAFDNGIDPLERIHYVFACLETENISCPTEVLPAYRVYVATIQPDGQTTHCNFWYNEQCGLVRACMENQRVYLLHKTISPPAEDGDIEIDNPLPTLGTLGSHGSPNPANPSTDVRFRVPGDTTVSVDVYDISGKLVRTLADAVPMSAGECSLNWNGCDDAGRTLASGVYVYRIQAAGLTESGRLTLVR